MTKTELIAKQQMEIENLKVSLEEFENARDGIISCIVSIGGPLNDNTLGYSWRQRRIFHSIIKQIEYL